jgi:hypothetical protein
VDVQLKVDDVKFEVTSSHLDYRRRTQDLNTELEEIDGELTY